MARFRGHSTRDIEKMRRITRNTPDYPPGQFRGMHYISGAQLAAEQANEQERNMQKLKNKGLTDVSKIRADSDAVLQANQLRHYGQQADLERGFKSSEAGLDRGLKRSLQNSEQGFKRSMQDDQQQFTAGENALNRDAETDRAFWDRDFKRQMQREQNQFLAGQGALNRDFEMNKPVYKEFTDEMGRTIGVQNVNTSEERLRGIAGGRFDDTDMERLMGPSPPQNTQASPPQNTGLQGRTMQAQQTGVPFRLSQYQSDQPYGPQYRGSANPLGRVGRNRAVNPNWFQDSFGPFNESPNPRYRR